MPIEEWPERGEYVIATVTRIVPYGAYVRLEEYEGREGFVHISEVSSSWVRNIRNFLREGQQTVLIVVRVDRKKGHIDLSLKRTTERDRRIKSQAWRRERKTRILLELVAKKMGKSIDELDANYVPVLEDEFGNIYDCLELAAKKGFDALKDVDVPKDLKRALVEVAKENITIRQVKVTRTLQLTCLSPRGVDVIREAIRRAKKSDEVGIYVVGCPNFRIEVKHDDYKKAEAELREAANIAISYIEKEGGQGALLKEVK